MLGLEDSIRKVVDLTISSVCRIASMEKVVKTSIVGWSLDSSRHDFFLLRTAHLLVAHNASLI